MLVHNAEDALGDYFLPQYLRLNEAIEEFTADMAADDTDVFRCGGGDIRFAVQRQLFFALFSSRELFDYFVACQTGAPLPDEDGLSPWVRLVAPYFRGERQRFRAPDLRERFLRFLHRRHGQPLIRIGGLGQDGPRVLFHVIHPKFIRYLAPIAGKLSVPYAFLAIEHPEMFDLLEKLDLPRVHVELAPESRAMVAGEVQIYRWKFRPGLFDAWIIKLNAVRRAFKMLKPDCVVVPEGNADLYELVNQSAKTVGVRTVCVQQGWAPVVHPGFRNMSYDSMCVWGERFAEMLAPFSPKQRFVATGSHIVPYRPQGDISDRKAIAFFLQNGAHWMTDKVWKGVFDLIAWAAERFPDREIRVREHPGDPLARQDAGRLGMAQNVKLMTPEQFSLEQVFSGCRVAVAINSTTILEAIASGVVPLILDVAGFGVYHPDVAGEGAAIEVNEFVKARTVLERLIDDDVFCASFGLALQRAQQRLFAGHGEQALGALVSEIEASRRSLR